MNLPSDQKKNDQNHFDQAAREWDMNKMHLERTQAIAALLLKKNIFRPGMIAMEFGAGTGLLSIALKDQFEKITLLDSAAEMVKVTSEKLREQGIRHLFPVHFDLEKEDLSGKTFDVIFSQMALHHVNDIGKIIYKFYHLLNQNGVLIIADLYKEDGSFHDREFSGHKGFDTSDLCRQLSLEGFKKAGYEPCYVIARPDGEGRVKSYPVFLMTAQK